MSRSAARTGMQRRSRPAWPSPGAPLIFAIQVIQVSSGVVTEHLGGHAAGSHSPRLCPLTDYATDLKVTFTW